MNRDRGYVLEEKDEVAQDEGATVLDLEPALLARAARAGRRRFARAAEPRAVRQPAGPRKTRLTIRLADEDDGPFDRVRLGDEIPD
ncbi:MAG TPA: hypothetical protein VGF92_23325 [Stellaceae bacterium]|jgi:hypothetical protein